MTVTISPCCTACGACVITCPAAALSVAPRRPAVDDERCTDCLACLEVCPVDAIDLVGGEAHSPPPPPPLRSAP